MSENLKFYKGMESALPEKSKIEVGALYHCIDTNNTYLGVQDIFIPVKENITESTKYGSSFGFSIAAATSALTAGTVYKVSNTYYFAHSKKDYEVCNTTYASKNSVTDTASLAKNTLYYFKNDAAVYKTTDLTPAYELYSSAVGKRQVGGGIVLDDGDASGEYSIAGGTVNNSLLQALTGQNLNVQINPSAAKGDMSITYGSGNTSYAAATNSIGLQNQAGYMGYYISAIINTKKIRISTDPSSQNDPTLTNLNTKWQNSNLIINNGESVYYCGKVTSVSGNEVSLDEDLPFTSLESYNGIPHSRMVIAIPPVDTTGGILGFGEVETYRPACVGEVPFGWLSSAFGFDNIVAGTVSSAFGIRNTVSGLTAFAVGRNNIASNFATFVTGYQNKVTGNSGIATGQGNEVAGMTSGAFGYENVVFGRNSFALGASNTIFNESSAALGVNNTITGRFGFAANNTTTVQGNCASAFGHGTTTSRQLDDDGNNYPGAPGYAQMVIGKYNKYDDNLSKQGLFIIGNGSEGELKNALVVTKNSGLSLGEADANIGQYALALGNQNKAAGAYSVAGGSVYGHNPNEALGEGSVAAGAGAVAYSRYSKSLGINTQTGYPRNQQELDKRPSTIIDETKINHNISLVHTSGDSFFSEDEFLVTVYPTIGTNENGDDEVIEEGEVYVELIYDQVIPTKISYHVDYSYEVTMSLIAYKTGDVTNYKTLCEMDPEQFNTFTYDFIIPQDYPHLAIRITGGHFAIGTGEIKLSNLKLSTVVFHEENIAQNSIAFGLETAALANNAVAGGYSSIASGSGAFAFGTRVKATGGRGIALGGNNGKVFGEDGEIFTEAKGYMSIAIGSGVQALGQASLAMGYESIAENTRSIAIGTGLKTGINDQVVLGKYNTQDFTAPFIIGAGTSNTDRKNALSVLSSGDVLINNKLTTTTFATKTNRTTLTESGSYSTNFTMASGTNIRFMANSKSLVQIYGTPFSTTSGQSEHIIRIGDSYSGGFCMDTAKSKNTNGTYSIGACLTLGARKDADTDPFGLASLSIGAYAKAGGANSAAFGYGAKTKSNSQVAVGKWNDPSDPSISGALFMVGNGSGDKDSETRSNAFVVASKHTYINTAATFNGDVNIANQNKTLTIDGNTIFNGQVTMKHDFDVEGILTVQASIDTNGLSVHGLIETASLDVLGPLEIEDCFSAHFGGGVSIKNIMVLSEYTYGTADLSTLPGVTGQIYFKKA